MEKRTKLKELSGKERREYIWDYYRWHILAGIIIFIVLISCIYDRVTYEEPILNVVMVNGVASLSEEEEAEFSEFLELYGYEGKTVACNCNIQIGVSDELNYQSSMVLAAYMAAKTMDFFIWTDDSIENYLDEGIMADLSEFLTKEELEVLGDDVIYAADLETGESYACAIRLHNQEWAKDYGYYGDFYIGVFFDASNSEAAKDFLEYLLGKGEM